MIRERGVAPLHPRCEGNLTSMRTGSPLKRRVAWIHRGQPHVLTYPGSEVGPYPLWRYAELAPTQPREASLLWHGIVHLVRASCVLCRSMPHGAVSLLPCQSLSLICRIWLSDRVWLSSRVRLSNHTKKQHITAFLASSRFALPSSTQLAGKRTSRASQQTRSHSSCTAATTP